MVDGMPEILLFSKDEVGVQPQHANESSSILICAYCSSGNKHDPAIAKCLALRASGLQGSRRP